MSNPIRDEIQKAISEHDVILFMKGVPERPMCGFSARTVAALDALGASYAAVDILPDPRIRQELSAISNWPTIPQLFVNGELRRRLRHRHRDVRDAASWPRRSACRRRPTPRTRRPSPPSRAPRPSRSATTSLRSALLVPRRRWRGGNEQPAQRTVPALVADVAAAQRFAATRTGRRRVRRRHAGRPHPRLQPQRAVPLREHDEGDADGRRPAPRRHTPADRPRARAARRP